METEGWRVTHTSKQELVPSSKNNRNCFTFYSHSAAMKLTCLFRATIVTTEKTTPRKLLSFPSLLPPLRLQKTKTLYDPLLKQEPNPTPYSHPYLRTSSSKLRNPPRQQQQRYRVNSTCNHTTAASPRQETPSPLPPQTKNKRYEDTSTRGLKEQARCIEGPTSHPRCCALKESDGYEYCMNIIKKIIIYIYICLN